MTSDRAIELMREVAEAGAEIRVRFLVSLFAQTIVSLDNADEDKEFAAWISANAVAIAESTREFVENALSGRPDMTMQ